MRILHFCVHFFIDIQDWSSYTPVSKEEVPFKQQAGEIMKKNVVVICIFFLFLLFVYACQNKQDCRMHTDLYLDLMKKILINTIYEDDGFKAIEMKMVKYDRECREHGADIPVKAHTMIGKYRLDNIQVCLKDIIDKRIPGDLIEAGAGRGGATIFMKAVLQAYGDNTRKVFVADSFEGFGNLQSNIYIDADKNLIKKEKEAVSLFLKTSPVSLNVSVEQVKSNFAKYGLLDDRVIFVKGWFKDSLHKADIGKLSLIRLDADLYSSTMDAIVSLYPKLSTGGYIIIDDYFIIPFCKAAVDDYRKKNNISDPIIQIDWNAAYWKKSKEF